MSNDETPQLAEQVGPAERAREAIGNGDLVAAYDATVAAVAAGDRRWDILYHQVLALARMGDTAQARQKFEEFGLAAAPDPYQQAIGPRLLKDEALARPAGSERQKAIEAALAGYRAIFDEHGIAFAGINAATLALLAGRTEEAARLARAVLDRPDPRDTDFYRAVTEAEAWLVLGDSERAAAKLDSQAVRESQNHGARSTSRRQLALVARHLGLGEEARAALLEPLTPAAVVHYAGHMFAADPAAEAALRSAIDSALEEEKVGFGFGALACGADILFAEALLERGAELNVILPFSEEEFLAQSVLPGGASWLPRFERCLERAASVTMATSIPYFGEPEQFGYSSRIAMGFTRLRAEHLQCVPLQLVMWDERPASGPAGTGADVATWKQAGGRSRRIAPGAIDRKLDRPPPSASPRGGYERSLAAMLFTDFVGFSALPESVLPDFWEHVMGTIAKVLDEHPGDVACRESWGDALYAVTWTAPAAAHIALELQSRLAEIDYEALGMRSGGGMRVGAHYGPVYRRVDPITRDVTFSGSEVSRTARIEPVTPPGAVFVTAPFAAILALEARDRFVCRYVGKIALAKKYGEQRMYRLDRAA